MTASADAATALGQVLTRVFGIDKRKGGSELLGATSCGFYGSAALADPNYGLNLFTPANVPALAGIAGATTSTNAAGSIITTPSAPRSWLSWPPSTSRVRGGRRGIHRVLRPRLPW